MAQVGIIFDFRQGADGSKTVNTAVPALQSGFALFTSFFPLPADHSGPAPPSGITTATLPSFGVQTTFLISNAGAQHGTDQNYVYVVLATQTPLWIRNLNFNAVSGSPITTCALEYALRRDFVDAVVLRTFALNQGMSSPDCALDLHVPSGVSYIRIRPTASMTVPGGDDIRYMMLKMAGAMDTGVLSLNANPLRGANPAAAVPDQTSPVELMFDFKRGMKSTNSVAAIDKPQTGLAGIFTSNAWDGENGVTGNGITDMSREGPAFLIYNYQPSRGRYQRYVFMVLAAQVPLILTKLATTILSPLSVLIDNDNPPHVSVVAAVEVSQTQDFQDVVEFGKISTSSPTLSLNTFIPRGVTFIRLRVLSIDGLGPSTSDWVSFTNCELRGHTVDDGWEKVGENAVKLLTQNSMLYAVEKQSGQLVRFSGVHDRWTKVSDSQYQFIGNEIGLYAISSAKAAVLKWNDTTNRWDPIGPAGIEELVAGRTSLYGIDHAGRLMAYNSKLHEWKDIGGPFRSVAVNDHFCFGISQDGQSVKCLQLGTSIWQTIGGPTAQLVAAGNALYRIDANHYVFLYDANTKNWIPLGGPFRQLKSQGIQLYGVTFDGLAVLKLKTIKPLLWEQIAGAADVICSNNDYIAGLRSGTVLLPKGTISHVQPRHEKRSEIPIPDVGDTGAWLFEFHTKDAFFAGYDGEVSISILLSEGVTRTPDLIHRVLPDTHFSRNGINLLTLDSIPKVSELTSFTLYGSDNWLGDHWTLGEVIAWNLQDQIVYNIAVDADVPNLSEVTDFEGLHCKPTTTIPLKLGSKYTRILIWPYRGLTSSVGHVSLALSTGTYISWAPKSDERFVVSAPAYQEMEYSDDISLFTGSGERDTPTYVVPVYGLDEAAIEKWWDEFQKNERDWRLITLNCSTVVYLALKAGGIAKDMPKEVVGLMDNYEPWSPVEILHLAIEVLQKTKSGDWREVSFWRIFGMKEDL